MAADTVPVLSTAELFREHGAFVWRLLRRLGVPPADRDDLTQEVFLAVHRALHTYEERNQLKAWLYRICVREAVRHLRALPKGNMDIEELEQISPDCPEASARASEARARIERLLATLDEPRRTVFVLYEVEELTMAEVAAAVGCPLQTAYARHNSAKKHVIAAARRMEAKERMP